MNHSLDTCHGSKDQLVHLAHPAHLVLKEVLLVEASANPNKVQ